MMVLMLNCFKKNGIVSIKFIFVICEIDSKMEGYFIIKLLVNFGLWVKLCRNGLLKMLVICSIVFSIMVKRKKMVMCGFLNSMKVFRFSLLVSDVVVFFFVIGIFGKVSV